jgi:hypothetical protein
MWPSSEAVTMEKWYSVSLDSSEQLCRGLLGSESWMFECLAIHRMYRRCYKVLQAAFLSLGCSRRDQRLTNVLTSIWRKNISAFIFICAFSHNEQITAPARSKASTAFPPIECWSHGFGFNSRRVFLLVRFYSVFMFPSKMKAGEKT